MGLGGLGLGHGADDMDDMAEINIIPLVDIMLVLLITFMVAAPLSISGISVSLPQSKAKGAQVNEKKIVLTIDKDGQYYIEKARIPSTSLSEKFEAIFALKQNKNLYIRADKDVSYGRVVSAMSAAKIVGVKKIAMLTTPEQN